MNTKVIGIIAESAIIHSLVKLGYTVSIPYGDNASYDLIVDTGRSLNRIQVKSAHIKNGVITATTTFRTGSKRREYGVYADRVDYIAVYCHENGMCYAIESSECGSCLTLRLSAPANRQSVGIRYAEDYTIEKVIK